MNLREYLDFVITMVDKKLLKEAVETVKGFLPEEKISQIQEVYKDDRVSWFLVRNLVQNEEIINLLEERGMTKEQLPGRDWDDYIIQIVEIAAGVRNQDCLETA